MKQFSYFCCVASIVSSFSDSSTSFASIFSPPSSANMSLSPHPPRPSPRLRSCCRCRSSYPFSPYHVTVLHRGTGFQTLNLYYCHPVHLERDLIPLAPSLLPPPLVGVKLLLPFEAEGEELFLPLLEAGGEELLLPLLVPDTGELLLDLLEESDDEKLLRSCCLVPHPYPFIFPQQCCL